MAYLALFVALGGTSYAAVTLSRNDVRSKHIKNGQVKKRDIAKNAINSRRVKNGTLRSKDFKPGELVAGAPGPQGAKGDPGPKGEKGDLGPTYGATTDWHNAPGSGCSEATLREQTIEVARRSLIFGTGQGAYDRQATNLRSGLLRIVLLDQTGTTTLAWTPLTVGTDWDTANAARIHITNTGVLKASGTPYVAEPGTYKLRLLGRTSDGTCSGNWIFVRSTLSYVLLGNQP